MTDRNHPDAHGTKPQGTIGTTYDQLAAAFGPPQALDGDGAWWVQRFANGTVATVYNEGPVFPEDCREWVVGGHVAGALGCVMDAVFGDEVSEAVEDEPSLPKFRDYLEARDPALPGRALFVEAHEALRAGYGSAAACGAPDPQGHALEFARLVLGVGRE